METTAYDSNNPLVDYAERNIWGNPEENHQHQVKLVRLTSDYGESKNYNYMGKWRSLPKPNGFFHIFSVGGLNPGFWNLRNGIKTRNPLDRWVNLAYICKERGVQLDLYNTKGFQFPKSLCWLMVTYDGLTLLAFQKLDKFPIPKTMDMYFRCYTPSIPVDSFLGDNPFIYETLQYENPSELNQFNGRYLNARTKTGFTGVFYNGVYFDGPPNAIPGVGIGDVVEFWHDPTVIKAERYQYKDLQNFYSDMDKKRKLILHPVKTDDFTLRYFDDNDYYLVGPNQLGLYLHRNDETTIRQLTHVDVAISDESIRNYSENTPDLKKLNDVTVLVLTRKTDWDVEWPNDHQRLRYLYRFDDQGIIKAMTGERSTVPEWTGSGLEQGAVMSFTRSQFKGIGRQQASLALGYNASTRVVSETPVKASFVEGGRGVLVPSTYQPTFTAWEYDANGKLLGYHNQFNTPYYNPFDKDCVLVEFTFGKQGRKLNYVVTNVDVPLDCSLDYRVYTVGFNVVLNTTVGPLVDVTDDTSVYKIVNGKLVWVGLDVINQRGVLVDNSLSLGYTFTLDHIDHSLAFALTVVYEDGGLLTPVIPANVDLWLNGHPLIDQVDWIFKDGYCYIINKEFIVEGNQTITVRAHGLSDDQKNPKIETELGFVEGGVIGSFKRYNLRADRVTRTVINGALYITDEVPRAERKAPTDLWDTLNGKPYMVKHVYCPVRFVEPYKAFVGYDLSRAVDRRVSDYMGEYLGKPNSKDIVLPNLQDKYRLYSPLLNVVVNGLINKLITLPDLPDGNVYSEQTVRELVEPYLWWLKTDPIALGFDRRYFAIMPFANVGKLTMTSKELIFIKQVNDSYLESACSIEGHFEVNNNVR